MIRPHFSATLTGGVHVEAHAGDYVIQCVIRDNNGEPGNGLGVYLYGTVDQLLALAEGIRDAVHIVEMEAISASVAADVAHTAEVGG